MPDTFLSTSALRSHGMTKRCIQAYVASGRLVRVRNGRYVSADTQPEMIRAARLGGRLDCISLLSALGVFVLDGSRLHIHVDIGASRLPRPPRDVVRHWRSSRAGREDLCADVIEALAQACRCQEPRAAIATLDSAWHLGVIDEAAIAEVFASLPRRYGVMRNLMDRRSEAGTETIVRLILRALGCHVDLQVRLVGVGRVDLIVDGWLIIECDSEAHHSGWVAQKEDRRRDVAAAKLGYVTIRLIAEDILYHRDEVQASLKVVLARLAPPVAPPQRPRRRRRT